MANWAVLKWGFLSFSIWASFWIQNFLTEVTKPPFVYPENLILYVLLWLLGEFWREIIFFPWSLNDFLHLIIHLYNHHFFFTSEISWLFPPDTSYCIELVTVTQRGIRSSGSHQVVINTRLGPVEIVFMISDYSMTNHTAVYVL